MLVLTLFFFVLQYIEQRKGIVIEKGWLDSIVLLIRHEGVLSGDDALIVREFLSVLADEVAEPTQQVKPWSLP